MAFFLLLPPVQAVASCCTECWPCRCKSYGECHSAPLPRAPLSPLHRWSITDTASFLQSLAPDGQRQTCPVRCHVPRLFVAPQPDINGTVLAELLRRGDSSAPLKALAPGDRALYLRRLALALRQETYGRPEALWLSGAEAPRGGRAAGRTQAAGLVSALVQVGWTARVVAPRVPHGSVRDSAQDSLAALARDHPVAVRVEAGLLCPYAAVAGVPLYTRAEGADCHGLLDSSLAAERVLAAAGCRANALCEPCVHLAARRGGRYVGALFVDAIGAEQSLLLHRFLTSDLFHIGQPPRCVARPAATVAVQRPAAPTAGSPEPRRVSPAMACSRGASSARQHQLTHASQLATRPHDSTNAFHTSQGVHCSRDQFLGRRGGGCRRGAFDARALGVAPRESRAACRRT